MKERDKENYIHGLMMGVLIGSIYMAVMVSILEKL